MKHLIITFALLLLIGCTPNWHVKKAIKKGWSPEKETIEVERLELIHTRDSITNEIIRTDTIRLKETRTIFQDRPITRQERLMYKDSIKHIEQLHKNELKEVKAEARKLIKLAQIESKRLETEFNATIKQLQLEVKIAKHENKRSKWWLWMLIGGALVYFRKYLFKLIKLLPL
jgi:hypothetical protein